MFIWTGYLSQLITALAGLAMNLSLGEAWISTQYQVHALSIPAIIRESSVGSSHRRKPVSRFRTDPIYNIYKQPSVNMDTFLSQIPQLTHFFPQNHRTFLSRHSRESGNPGFVGNWTPASEGVTNQLRNLGLSMLVPNFYPETKDYRMPFKVVRAIMASSDFGLRYHPIEKRHKFHEGIDFPQPLGTAVYPARSGRVIFAGWKPGYGFTVIVKHMDNLTTRYGHLAVIHTYRGAYVKQGITVMGRVGATGVATGCHLHFEIRDAYGRALNPRNKMTYNHQEG